MEKLLRLAGINKGVFGFFSFVLKFSQEDWKDYIEQANASNPGYRGLNTALENLVNELQSLNSDVDLEGEPESYPVEEL